MLAGMKLPFTAVARLAQSSPSVAASVAKGSPLSSTFKKYLRVDGAGFDIALNKLGQGRRKKKAVPVEAVDVDIALRGNNPRPIVGEGGPGASALPHNLGLSEGRIERVGC